MSDAIDWGVAADDGTLSDEQLANRARVRAALAGFVAVVPDPDAAAVGARRKIFREHGHPPWQECRDCQTRIAAWDAQHGTAVSTPPVTATPTVPVPTATARTTPTVPDTPEALNAAINAAPDDTTRARVLAAAPRDLRAQYRAMLVYRAMAETPSAHDVFVQQLDAAPDDAARRAIIAAAPRKILQDWRFWHIATPEAAARRFLALANRGAEATQG